MCSPVLPPRSVCGKSVDQEQMRRYAAQVLESRGEQKRAVRRLEKLAQDNAVLQAQAAVVGTATACVLWCTWGNPQDYHCGAAYRKAMGLNLKERSSALSREAEDQQAWAATVRRCSIWPRCVR